MSDHAIVVGIKTYPGLQNLDGPCNDALAFRDWLLDPDGGNLDPGNVRVRLTSDYPAPNGVGDAHPTASDLADLFRDLIRRAAVGEHIGERLFVFVAGHGFADSQDIDSAALFAANAEFLFPLHVAVMHYVSFLQRAWAFEELIVIMDSCRSTNPMHEISKPALPRINPHPNSGRVKVFVGFGATFTQVAREKEFDGEVRGVFSMALLDALENAKPNRLGRVTGSIVKKYVHNGIRKFADNVDAEIEADEHKDVLFVARPPTGIPIEFRIREALIGKQLVVLFGGREEVHREVVVASPVSVPLEPGLYTATIGETFVNLEVPVNDTVTL